MVYQAPSGLVIWLWSKHLARGGCQNVTFWVNFSQFWTKNQIQACLL